MRKSDFAKERDRRGAIWMPLSVADRQRRPLPDSIRRQNRRPPRRRSEEGGSGVGLVMLGEQDLAARHAEIRRDDSSYPELLAERVFHRLRERTPGMRKSTQRASENAIELQHWTLIEHNGIERGRLDASMLQTPLDRRQWKRRVALVSREPLFLHSADGHSIHNDRCCRIVIVRGDSENLHLNTHSSVNDCAPAKSESTRVAPGVLRVWQTRRRAARERSIESSEEDHRARRRVRSPAAGIPSICGAIVRATSDAGDARARRGRVV